MNMRKKLLLSLPLLMASAMLRAQGSAATLAGLKACEEGEVEFTIPAGAVVSGTGALYGSNIIFLWDGTDGVKLVFDTADGDVYRLVQQRPIGQQLSGFIYGRYEPHRKDGPALVCRYGVDKTNYYRELSLVAGDGVQPVPANVSIADLLQAVATGSTAYDHAYVKVAGGFMLTDNYKLFDEASRSIVVSRDYMGVDEQGEYAFDFTPALGKQGSLYAVFEPSREEGAEPACRLAVVDSGRWFDVTGDIVSAGTVVFSAATDADNVYGEERPGVDVQIRDVHYEAGGYYPLYLPLDVPREEFERVFGADTRLMMLSNVGSRVNGKQVMLYFETQPDYTQTSAWSTYLVCPSQDVSDPVFHNVHLEKGDYVMRLNMYAGNNTHGNVYYYNTFNPVTLATDGTHRLIHPSGAVITPHEGQNVVGAFTAYLDLTQWYGKHPEAEPARIYITIDGEEAPTAISEAPLRPAVAVRRAHDLQGRRLGAVPSGRGVYIIDGKKTVR